ncbi:MAG: hypothetical protein L0Y58_08205 [Verrucomicrobia subdivision 3 bacterium]|nr:hypothetical protein [Limisphaerales bacterium]
MKAFRVTNAFMGLLLTVHLGNGQNFAINWHTIDGGGGTSSGAQYRVSGTAGQPDAGKLSGGNYILRGGFWGVATAVQVAGSPDLSITASGANVILSWPSPSTGFILQQTTDLTSGTWTTVASLPGDDGATKRVTVPAFAGRAFFRLVK